MPCRVCGFTNPAGTAVCAACGTQAVEAPRPAARPSDAVCASHPAVPALLPCARCGTFYCGACLARAGDAQSYCALCLSRGSLPWDQREELGTLRAFWLTSTRLLTQPTATLSQAQPEGSLGSSVLYALIASLAGFLTTISVYAVLYGSVAAFALTQSNELGDGGHGALGALGLLGVIVFLIIYLLILVGAQLGSLFVLSAIEHLVLHLSGERGLRTYATTVRAHALGLSPYVLGLLPFCGVMVMGLWSIVMRCMTLVHLQKVSAGKAVLAVLAPVIVMCGCLALFYAMMLAAVLGAAGLSTQ